METFFSFLGFLDNLLWQYIALFIILFVGIYFTIKSNFFQISILIRPRKYIKELLDCAKEKKDGIHPIKLYFSSLGGMVGVGNLVMIVGVITLGGPSGLIWMWIAAFIGMIVKYSEIYLGIKYRVKNTDGSYDGGPMYYLHAAFGTKIVPMIMCVLLCIYGVEISQFLVVTDTFVSLGMNRYVAIGLLLVAVVATALGGVRRLSNVCSTMMPPFMLSYIVLGITIIIMNYEKVPELFCLAFSEMFTLKGGMAGLLLAAHHGVSRAVYTGDIGIGYDSIVQSETKTPHPEKQARIAIFAIFTEVIICTITITLVFVTDAINVEGLQMSQYVLYAMKKYIPFTDIFIAILFFIAAFTTVIGYLVVGRKCAKFLGGKVGERVYLGYAIIAFIGFSFRSQTEVFSVMMVSGGLLMVINVVGVFLLRNEIEFKK